MANELLADAHIFPDWHCVIIQDLDTLDSAQSGQGGPCSASAHEVIVETITSDEAIDNNQDVRVRIYSGSDATGVGEMIFDGSLEFDSGYIAVGNVSDTGIREHKVKLPRAGKTRVQIIVDEPSRATEVNVLIHLT